MKTISEYTIYCTPEQTKKALELGAPVKEKISFRERSGHLKEYREVIPPTAEQMIGWLEEQGIVMDVSGAYNPNNMQNFMYRIGFRFNYFESDAIDYPSRKEATLAAIDAALEYLSNKAK